mmetsp:Transcript_22419/g.44461  ORF Transcript_22419/g.44461 Transcript_22419/m.44461 type:complete len:135 (-) Transcript_22419:54-458(-)
MKSESKSDLDLCGRILDTQLLHMGLPDSTLEQPSLKTLAEMYHMSPEYLHNGGNDAYYTLAVMLGQCGIVAQLLDAQQKTLLHGSGEGGALPNNKRKGSRQKKKRRRNSTFVSKWSQELSAMNQTKTQGAPTAK